MSPLPLAKGMFTCSTHSLDSRNISVVFLYPQLPQNNVSSSFQGHPKDYGLEVEEEKVWELRHLSGPQFPYQ